MKHPFALRSSMRIVMTLLMKVKQWDHTDNEIIAAAKKIAYLMAHLRWPNHDQIRQLYMVSNKVYHITNSSDGLPIPASWSVVAKAQNENWSLARRLWPMPASASPSWPRSWQGTARTRRSGPTSFRWVTKVQMPTWSVIFLLEKKGGVSLMNWFCH